MSTLWWVRHGPTHAKGMVGWTDLPADLSDTGQLRRLSALLPDAPVISSTLSRAVETADAIQDGRPRLPHDPDLRELHFGEWEMRRHDEIEEEDPAHIRAFWDQPGEISAPGGESWADLQARVGRAADRLLARGTDVIVVAHFGAILTQYQRAAGLTTRDAFGQKIDNLSVSAFRWAGSGSSPRDADADLAAASSADWTVLRINHLA
ncbi:histidine phosphatase family protein [Maribius pontilimi]|uniref:Histidine phosphatase family protein n=1 Tax=Palleronia pontilimi TaxID=1964209 RepID=A0A934IG14_9RHOB|nr:histidine phosphatase family protein [Palleronia pontilimi]MBJ3761189.1 histidine phosphatase family protein [Palleronia pontilimi]